MNIELNKTYRTRSGQKCRIICVDRKHQRNKCLILGLIDAVAGEELIDYLDGGMYSPNGESVHDLISEWVDPVTYDRSLLPAWANRSIAMDESGNWFCYSDIPTLAIFTLGSGWLGSEHARIPDSHAPKWTGDWKQSLLIFED